MQEILEPRNDGLVYKIQQFNDGTITEGVFCAQKCLVIDGMKSVLIGTTLPLTIQLQDWQYHVLAENHQIIVQVTGSEVNQQIMVQMNAGLAEFDFISNMAGKFTITAMIEGITHDLGHMEVLVDG